MRVLVMGSKEYPMGTADGTDSPSGGMEVYVQGLCDALEKKGVDITLITRLFQGSAASEKMGRIKILRVPFLRGFYLRNPTFNAAAFVKALSLNFDVIISNGEVSNLFCLALSRIRRKPVIMVSHGVASSQPQYNKVVKAAFSVIDKLTYNNADAVVTHAPWQMKGTTDRYTVVMPGFDRSRVEKLSSVQAKGLRSKYADTEEKVIVYTGRMVGVKGVEYLIRSLGMVKRKHICIIVGDGPDTEKCKSLAKSEKANVVFTGFRKDVASFLSIADVFVLPSFSESLNYSLLESAYMGVPIVCTDIGVISRDSAILARPGDEKSLAGAIDNALSKRDERRISNAKKYVSRFDWNRAADSYIKVMRRLVK